MVNTPVGVSRPLVPVETVVTAISRPLRYTYIRCTGKLTIASTGPAGAMAGAHRYSPGFSASIFCAMPAPLSCPGVDSSCAISIRATELPTTRMPVARQTKSRLLLTILFSYVRHSNLCQKRHPRRYGLIPDHVHIGPLRLPHLLIRARGCVVSPSVTVSQQFNRVVGGVLCRLGHQ